MSNIDVSLKNAKEIVGALGVSLVDYTSGMSLGSLGGAGLDLDVAAANDLAQLSRTNPHCCVLVVATFQQLPGMPNMHTFQSQFDRTPDDTHFLLLQQDSRLSILTPARHLEAISLELAQEATRQSSPSQPAAVEVSDQLVSALASFDRNFTATLLTQAMSWVC